jgi:hypothetical protein
MELYTKNVGGGIKLNEIAFGGKRTKEVEYHWSRVYGVTFQEILLFTVTTMRLVVSDCNLL